MGGRILEYILLVTWILGAQSASSYTAEFGSLALCADAKSKLAAEEQRITELRRATVGTQTPSGGIIVGAGPTPTLMATCAKKR